MNTLDRRTTSSRIPGYSQNAVLQLIVASGVGYVAVLAVSVTLVVFGKERHVADSLVMPFVALPAASDFLHHPWTILTYGWAHSSFWQWLTNMIWLYTFGSVMQNLLGFREVIPTYLYGLTLGALAYLGVQLIPGIAAPLPLMTAQAGVMALAAASITMAPKYRFYFGEHFSIPMLVVAGLYFALNLLVYAHSIPMLVLSLGGLLTGYLVVTLLRNGYRPGAWMYDLMGTINDSVSPDERKLNKIRQQRRQQTIPLTRKQADREVSQNRVDEILDKINQYGVQSLTQEEKDVLQRAAKETQD
jgi:membrane associated rhomboid family serine protease